MTPDIIFIGGILVGLFAGFIIGGSYEATKWYKPEKQEDL